jgi:hypothetical protein
VPAPTIFEDLDGEGLGTKGRITAVTVAEGLDRKKIEALLKVCGQASFLSFSIPFLVMLCMAMGMLTSAQRGGGMMYGSASQAAPVPTIFEDLNGEGLGTRGRIAAVAVAEGLDRKKIEALLKVSGMYIGSRATCASYSS